MSLKRRVVRALDAPGGRTLLGWMATRRVRRLLRQPTATVAYRGIWVHQLGRYVMPDGPRFEYDADVILSWREEEARCRRSADDYWFRFYMPRPGDTIVDIGAGRGEDVLAFSERVGPTGRVLAIEAHPATCRLLEAFCTLNGLANVTVMNAALMDRVGSVAIENEDDWRKNTVRTDAPAGNVTHVPATTFEAVCDAQRLDSIAFLKMNIEGAERQALMGMGPVLEKVRHLCVCCHDFRADRGEGEQYRTRAFVESFLRSHGFDLASRVDDGRSYVLDHVHGSRTPGSVRTTHASMR